MRIDKDCYGTIAGIWAAALVLLFVDLYFIPFRPLAWIFAVLLIAFMGFVTWFHRVPVREKVGNETVISSVADGKVVIVEKAFEREYLKRECIQVSIYMNFFDVHANFWPADGVVTYYKYYPGKHFLAFKPKASEENEHACTGIRTDDGKDILFKQLAGTFARRIVCYSEPGMKTKAGEQCGIIKFGSRIDMFLPTDADIKVEIGDKVRACESVIALL